MTPVECYDNDLANQLCFGEGEGVREVIAMDINAGEFEGEAAFFNAKRWDRRNRADLIESVTPCHLS